MEVKVENIRTIDMLKARVKNRVARSKCFKNASLILIGITTLSIALNIYLIINYTMQENTSESEHHTSSSPMESSRETPTVPIDNSDTNPGSQYPTQQSTEGSTLHFAASASSPETEPTSTPDTTSRPPFVDTHTTPPSASRTRTSPAVHTKNNLKISPRIHSPPWAMTRTVRGTTTLRTSSTRKRPSTASVQPDSSTTTHKHEEASPVSPQTSASTARPQRKGMEASTSTTYNQTS
uniref:Attachment glycoprotein n=1 Tax=human metapneumovirus TaxID=162145 RepID=Q6RYV6_9MONO|nr:attachment glycoprotein [Human metapneumovirus]AAS48471.1 attachment glycoprotein [Human metapneumovirus]AAS48472.1 attachment glycoprotein [Human metapneumovirus]AAS48473.1 attachment glycoprotein [Human metapneumovirus]